MLLFNTIELTALQTTLLPCSFRHCKCYRIFVGKFCSLPKSEKKTKKLKNLYLKKNEIVKNENFLFI